METCFSCGKKKRHDKCEHCGYSFSIELICPRKKGILCIHTKKVCKEKDYESCKILRAND